MRSPELTDALRAVQRPQGFTVSNAVALERVHRCLSTLSSVIPEVDGNDRRWAFWLRTQRGSLEDFGDVADLLASGDIDSRQEFEELWRSEFSESVQWWHLSIVRFPNELWFTLGRKLQFGVDLDGGSFRAIDPSDEYTGRFLTWLLDEVDREVTGLRADPAAYNAQISQQLPLRKRYGRILRRDLWREAKDPGAVRAQFKAVDIPAFEQLVRELAENAGIPEMTLSSYLNYCRICYEAVAYESLKPVHSPIDMYRRMADLRDDGMLGLPPNDAAAFEQWLKHGRHGGHPFEICRGGNSTHISLYPCKGEAGWHLWLAGFSRSRIVETARMALALHRSGAPLVLQDKEEMLRMLTATDFIGIVPDDVPVGYNHCFFPREDRIFDFAHLWQIEDVCGSVPDCIHWYPLEGLRPLVGLDA